MGKPMPEDHPKIQIRMAKAAQVEAIAAVLYEAFAEYESLYTAEAFAATTPTSAQLKNRLSKGATWIALLNEKIVGTVSVVPENEALYIRSMAILPEARGQRIGERLLQEIEDHAVFHNYRKLFLNTTPFLDRAIQLYEKFGFIRRGADDLFGTPLLTLEKSLASELSSKSC
jgi:N-acetylglutamate synthase-like GNAT family acetyltransferase